MKQYRSKQWRAFREEMSRLFGYRCSECEKSQSEGVCLQVHRKEGYDPARKIWDYKPDEIEVLCKGCHARRHGKIVPRNEWICVGDNDLQELVGECELCGQSLRYEFFVEHDDWSPMTVGTDCCDNLTVNKTASERQKAMARMAKFVSSELWILNQNTETRTYKGKNIKINRNQETYMISIENNFGKKKFESANLAKKHVLVIFDSGKLDKWLRNKKR
jgi:hypothetical protein